MDGRIETAPTDARARRRRTRAAAAIALAVAAALPAAARAASGGGGEASATRIRAFVEAGRLEGLRWADLSDYRTILVALYEPRGFAPLWSDGGKPTSAAVDVAAAVARAAERGLDPADYDAALLAEWAGTLRAGRADADAVAAFDVATSVALLRHLSDVHLGRVSPKTVAFELDVEPRRLDLAALVAEAEQHDRIEDLVARVEPNLAQNRRLKAALARYRELATDPSLAPPRIAPPVKPGDALDDAPALARWLAGLGDLAPAEAEAAAASGRYDDALVSGVKRFQVRHGLADDGVIGKATAEALGVPLGRRVRQLELALERLRWLPELAGDRFVIVNVPAFSLTAFEPGEDRPRLEMRVVVGKAVRTQTPVLAGRLRYLEFRPYWNVPRSIAVKEILPKLRANPGYLASQDMELVSGGSDQAPVVGVSAESIEQLAAGSLRVRQRPGPKNSLGRVKFIFPNPADVYLHDTPSQSLFARERRDFSHGCVRVADPVALAEWLLAGGTRGVGAEPDGDAPGDAGDGSWTRERIREAMDGERRRVLLREPVPVILFYTTAVARADGSVGFYRDLYGHDATLERALARGYPFPP